MKSLYSGMLFLAAGLAFFTGAKAEANELKGAKPNIVMIIGDDICWRDFGFMGSPNARTPNLDRLAGEGMVFDRLYTAASMCAPCRTHIYTGMYPVRSGGYPNHCVTKNGTKSIVHYLQDQGYRIGLTGKTHIAPRPVFPFEKIDGFTVNCNSPKPSFDMGPSEAFMTRDREQPFCELICSIHAHGPWTAGDPGQYDPAKLVLPENLYDSPGLRESLCKYYAEIGQLDVQVGAIMKVLRNNNLMENTLIVFLSEQGYSVPGGKWTCFEDGLRAAGFVWWPAQVKSGRSSAIVEYVDILPTLIEIAGGTPDYTLLDGKSFAGVLAGKAKTHKIEAYGLHTNVGVNGALPYPSRTIRDERYRLIVNYMSDDEFVAGVTKGGLFQEWKDCAKEDPSAAKAVERIVRRPRIELYDHDKDPYEMNNLADNPEYEAVVSRLQSKLDVWLEQQGDTDPVKTELAAVNHLAPYAKKKTQRMLDALKK